MKRKKLLSIIFIALAFVIVSGSIVSLSIFISNKNKEDEANKNRVTITFNTNGGSPVDPIKIKKGEKLTSLPQSYLAGSSFDYWYTDEELKNEFKIETVIESDMTLFAGFKAIKIDANVTAQTKTYVEDVEQNHVISIVSNNDYSAQELLEAIKIEAITGYLPWNEADDLADGLPKEIYGWFEITHEGALYTIAPKKITFEGGLVYAWTAGQLYQVTIVDGMNFYGLESSIVQYTFRVKDEDKSSSSDNVQYKDIDNLCYVDKNDITNLNDIAEVSQTTGEQVFKQDENGVYGFCFDEAGAEKYEFKQNNILCIGDGKKLDVSSLFVKVIEVVERPGNGVLEFLVRAVDADISEVFEKIDVNYNEPIDVDDIIDNLDTEEIKQVVQSNGGLDKVTTLMANMLMISDEVQEVYASEVADTKTAKVNPGTGLPDFCYNADIRNEATLLKIKLLEDAEVKVTLGNGHNPNFDTAYTDNFVALKITFSYETTIKNRLQVKAEISITQYLAASAQGYLDYDWGVFKLKWAEFDFAINLYSQTDIDFKILVRTVRENGANRKDENKQDGDNKFVDIADKIAEKINSDEGEEPDNLVAELREMLDSEDGEIELFRAPILNIPIKIIPILPVMEVNVELDFLVTMNFAAGFSAHLSVLEAVQVGVTGSTKTKSISSYKYDNLPGGNQYALQLSACGYLGFKAGFEGGISVSFCGLSTLGRVGVWVYSGAYVDIYGFAQATLVKQNSMISQSLVGGYYIEIGIFLDVKLEARSQLFGTKVGVTLFSEKWPLVSFGNKEVLVSIKNKSLEETVYIANNGENSASIKLDNLPKLTGTYIDITTGKTYSKEVSWEKVTLKTSLSNFQYNPIAQTIEYYNYSSWRPASETCVATYYYDGPILQFSMSSSKYKDLCPFAQTKIVYYDATKLDREDAGKEVILKFYSLVDGKKELLEERKVLAGSIVYSSSEIELDTCKFVNISWDKTPWETVVSEDTEFVCSADLRQAYSAFIYYDATKNAWISDIRVSNLGEVPIAPEVSSGDKVTFAGWKGRNGINNKVKSTKVDEIGPTITADDLDEYGFFIGTTFGKDLTKSVATFEREGFNIGNHTDDLLDSKNKSDEGIVWYYTVASIYIAQYDREDCKLKIHNYDINGNEIIEEYDIEYSTTPIMFVTYSAFSREFLGFAEEENGDVVYAKVFDLGNITEDTEIFAIYRKITHEVKLYYYDIETHDYKLYKTVTVDGGEKLSTLGSDLEYIKNKDMVEEEGVETTFLRVQDVNGETRTSLNETTIFTRDLNIYPVWARKVDVILSSGSGEFIHKDSEGNTVTQEKIFTESKLNYKLTLNSYCIKEVEGDASVDHCYKFVGWKNEVTGEELKFEDPNDFEIEVVCKVPTTFTAIFEYAERTDYNVKITTTHGTLKDGVSKELNFNNITFSRYNEIIKEYNLWRPESYRDEEAYCVYNSYLNERKEGTTCFLEYRFEPTYDIVTINIILNGGVSTAPGKYEKLANGEIDLSKHVATKSDDYGTWKMAYWTDSKGNRYEIDDKYQVSGPDTLTLHWEIETYIDYTVTLKINGEEVETKLFHKDDTLEFLRPEQAEGKAFSGWTWLDSKGQTIEPLTKMPAENLTLEATVTDVFVVYKVNGIEISKVIGRVGSEQTVRETHVKEGHTVSSWTTEDVTVSGGKFTMPENDVVFNATATVNSYTVTYYHNDEVFIESQTVEFGTYVSLQNLPEEENEFFAWVSDDVVLGEFGFTMPAKNVSIRTVAGIRQYILYYVNDELYSYRLAVPNKVEYLLGTPNDLKYDGLQFSGWYVENQSLRGQESIVVPNQTTFICGYFTSGTTTVNIYFDEQNETPDLVMKGNVNDSIKITMKLANQEISGFKVDGVIVNEIVVSGTEEINAYVQYGEKKYVVSYAECGFNLPNDATYVAGSRVDLAELPTGASGQTIDGWFVDGVDILTDQIGRYFIMPQRNVVINLKMKTEVEHESEFVTASTFITSPVDIETVLFEQYKVYDNHSVVFSYPTIEGYEFVCWKDENGNVVAHDKLAVDFEKMNGQDCNFYAEYRKLEVHVAEFRIDNQIVGYREFYDSFEVSINAPLVSLEEGQVFTGWQNLYVSAVCEGNILTFSTGDRNTHENAKKDLVFVGFTYVEEDSYALTISYPDGDYETRVNNYFDMVLDRFYNDVEVEYELSVKYSINGGEIVEIVVKNAVTLNNGEFVVFLNISNFCESLKQTDSDTVQITTFVLRATEKVWGPEFEN